MNRIWLGVGILAAIAVLSVVAYLWNTTSVSGVSGVAGTLSEEEVKALIEMRQEEKLARDVYLALYEKWGIPAFRNIARSEQTHTDMVRTLLEKFGIPDPVDNTPGTYKDEKFYELYRELVNAGSASEVNALIIGATIEDLDIKDLQYWLERVSNPDIRAVFCNLMRGSENHLRAFTSLLERYGVEYQPKYITEDEYETIIKGGTITTEYCG